MKTLNQVRETALYQIGQINAVLSGGSSLVPPIDAHEQMRATALLLDMRDYHDTVLAMCDRLDTPPVAVAVSSRNHSDD